MDLKQDEVVEYDNGVISGMGRVVGVSSTHQPVIGKVWIIQDESGNVPNETYKFDTFVCFECNITQI